MDRELYNTTVLLHDSAGQKEKKRLKDCVGSNRRRKRSARKILQVAFYYSLSLVTQRQPGLVSKIL